MAGNRRARAAEADVNYMEAALKTVLPASYRTFITSWGEAFTPSLLTLIVNKELNLFDVQNIPLPRRAVEDTQLYWSGGMPSHLVGFANDCMGNLFGFARLKPDSARPSDAPILVFDHDANEVFQVAGSSSRLYSSLRRRRRSRLTMTDCSSPSRTCNRCSRSPAAIPRSPDYGQRFTRRLVSKGSSG